MMEKQPKNSESSDASTSAPTLDPQTAYYQQIQPPPAYTRKNRFLTPKTFRAAVNKRIDDPFVTIFRLGARVLQFVFALTAGICYAIELGYGSVDRSSNADFIYTQVVFGLSLIVLMLDAVTVREYRFTWMVEWTLCILWFVVFAVFYITYHVEPKDPRYTRVNIGVMKNVVWIDLINALLWVTSALFSTTMCCSGLKAKIRGKKEEWRVKRANRVKQTGCKAMDEMEQGQVREAQPQQESLPRYEEVPVDGR